MRYVLYPGPVDSKNDRDTHFIDGPTLAKLYGVDVRKCVYANQHGFKELPDDVRLFPRFDGNYTLNLPIR